METNDQKIDSFLQEFSKGYYGSFTKAFDFMQHILNMYGHTIEPVSDKVFKVMQKSIDRIDSTIKIQKTYQINF